MRVLITGGTGFLGRKLAAVLLRDGIALDDQAPRRVDEIVLFDAFPGEGPPLERRVRVVTGDIALPPNVEAVAHEAELVWHLAAIVSANAEAEFDLGMRVNVDGTRVLLEVLRATGRRPRLVFASSLAVFGGRLPSPVPDDHHLTPQSSYGTQKAIGELLVADYSRKGFIDGRSLRLPTVAVRPGKPNKAASSFLSGIIREPLSGETAECPVPRETAALLTSPRRIVEALTHAMSLSDAAWGTERSLSLPGITVTVGEMLDALERIAGPKVAGRVRFTPDEFIERIVRTWPVAVTAGRAREMGFTVDEGIEPIIRAHIEDELGGRVPG